LFPKDATAI